MCRPIPYGDVFEFQFVEPTASTTRFDIIYIDNYRYHFSGSVASRYDY